MRSTFGVLVSIRLLSHSLFLNGEAYVLLEGKKMLNYDWENSVGYWICSASHALRKALDARLCKEGITMRQWEVLAWLSAQGCGCQSELADQLGIEPHTLAGILSRMEKAGLLTRRCSATDRRKNSIHPTEKAEELWQRVSIITHEMRDLAVRGMSQQDLDNLKRLCEQIYNNTNESNRNESGERKELFGVRPPIERCLEESENSHN